MNATDLERWGPTLYQLSQDHPDDLGGDWFYEFGEALWSDWQRHIAEGRHPPRKALLAFARAWSVPGAPWGPSLTLYLADRLDPDVPTPDRGGHPGKSEAERWADWRRDRGVAVAVVALLREGRDEDEAIAEVAQRLGPSKTVTVRIALETHRDMAEKIAGTPAGDMFVRVLDASE